MQALRREPVATQRDSLLWNEYIDRYRCLGYHPLPGAQLRYVTRAVAGLLTLLGFGAAAWRAAPRGDFIGWAANQRPSTVAAELLRLSAAFQPLPSAASRAHLAKPPTPKSHELSS